MLCPHLTDWRTHSDVSQTAICVQVWKLHRVTLNRWKCCQSLRNNYGEYLSESKTDRNAAVAQSNRAVCCGSWMWCQHGVRMVLDWWKSAVRTSFQSAWNSLSSDRRHGWRSLKLGRIPYPRSRWTAFHFRWTMSSTMNWTAKNITTQIA